MALVFPRIDVPANGPLGIRVDAHVLAYTVAGGITRQVECAVVKAVEDAAFQPGDILVSCNDRPLINCALQSGTSHLATVTAALTEAAHEDRTLLLLRSAAAGGYNPAYNTTIVTMSADEAAMIFDDAALQQQHEDERRAFEVQPASAELLSVTIPYEQPSLGLEIQVQRLTYVNDEGRKVSLDCCVVLDSHFRAQILPGDIIVKVNYNSVVSDRRVLCRSDADSRAFFDDFMGTVSSAERPLKLVYLRPSAGVGRRGLSPRLLVRLPRSLEDAVFMSTPLNVLSEDEEISRRVEEELYRLQKEKDERARVEEERRKHEAELQAAAEAAEARRVEEEVLRRVEVEKRRITDELRHAEEEASRLEAEAQRIALELKKVEDEERKKRVAEEVQRRVEEQQRRADGEAERLRFEEAVQARAREKARGLLGESWTAGAAAGPSRPEMLGQEADRRALAEARRLPDDATDTRRRGVGASAGADAAQQREEDMLRLAADQARMLVALEDERSQALQREQEIKRRAEAETQRMMELIRRQESEARMTEEVMQKRIADAVAKRVDEEARRIKEQLRLAGAALAPSGGMSERKEMSPAEKARRIEELVKQRVDAELSRLTNQRPSAAFAPSPNAPASAPATAAVAFAASPVPVSMPVSAAAHGGGKECPEFSIFEIGAPPGPLGLVLFLHTIRLAMGPGRTLSVYCCIVKESKTAAAIKPGDVLMSVGDHTLLVDEFQAPLGQGLVEACVKVLTTAPNPRRIRFYRSGSVDVAGDESTLSPEEAERVAPEIFNGGDGSKRLLEALEIASLTAPLPTPAPVPAPVPVPTLAAAGPAPLSFVGSPTPGSPGDVKKGGLLQNHIAPPAGFERQHGITGPYGFNGEAAPKASSSGAGAVKPLGTSAAKGEGEVLTGAERRRRMQQRADAGVKVLEHLFRDTKPGKPTGLDIAPVMLGMEAAPGRAQVFWAGMVVANRSEATRITPGDIVVYVGGSLCLVDIKQARTGMEFTRAIRETIASAPAPRAVRFVRLTDTDLGPGEEPLPFYQLNAEDSSLVSNFVFSGESDRGRSMASLLSQVAAAASAEEAIEPLLAKQRAQREAIEAKVLHDVERGQIPRRLRSAKAAAEPPSGPKEATIHEVVFRQSGPLPLASVLEPLSITFESLPGKQQTFWCAVVNGAWQNIRAGDIVLYVNTHMCMVDRSQARNGFEFILALKDVLEAASVPRAVRFVRLGR